MQIINIVETINLSPAENPRVGSSILSLGTRNYKGYTSLCNPFFFT
jgi:hypothetical protein